MRLVLLDCLHYNRIIRIKVAKYCGKLAQYAHKGPENGREHRPRGKRSFDMELEEYTQYKETKAHGRADFAYNTYLCTIP